MKWSVNSINTFLADSCQKACAACCKLGMLFLPDEEYDAIVSCLQNKSPHVLETFKSRCKKHDGFYLYDQQQACQFLDSKNLCRLHGDKVKPTECYSWPLHVYIVENNALEIRVSLSCCDGYKYIESSSSILRDIKMIVERWGPEIFKKFRAVYKGSYDTKPIAKIENI